MKGNFGFISSNKFMRSTYGQPLRKLLTEKIHMKQIIDFGELPVFPEAATFPAIFLTEKYGSNGKPTLFAQIRSLDFQSLETAIIACAEKLPPSAFAGSNWSLEKEEKNVILRKMDSVGKLLGDYVNGKIKFGVKTGFNKAFIIDGAIREKLIAENPLSTEIIKPLIVGDDVRKYEINFNDKYLIWTYIGVEIEKYPSIRKYLEQYRGQLEKRSDKGNFWYELRPCEYYSDFQKPKIVYPDIAITCRFCLDRDGYFPEATCFEIPEDDPFLASLLNSNLLFFYIRSLTPVLGDSGQRGRLRFKTVYLKALPIRRISFSTPPDRRASLLEEAKSLYSEFLSTPDSVNKLLDFVGARLEAEPEESDVVHDLLAYLAERMIEMNKEKNAEIKGFLGWFEGEIGASVEELANKTAIKEYYVGDFEVFVKALAKNKKKLKEGYDPTRRNPKDRLQKEYDASIGKLEPLLKRIEATDGLIDRVVYRLYGLTPDEIKIVEESISGSRSHKEPK